MTTGDGQFGQASTIDIRGSQPLRHQEVVAPGRGVMRKGQGKLLDGLAPRISVLHVSHFGASFRLPGRPVVDLPVVEIALKVSRKRKADKHADGSSGRHRDQQADEAEQRAEGEQREHQPDRMQADALADELRLQDVAFEELAAEEDAEHSDDPDIIRPELDDRHTDRQHQPDQRTDIGDEADHAGEQADQQAEIQADERQADGVIDAEDEAERALPADEAGDRLIDLAGDLAHRLAT